MGAPKILSISPLFYSQHGSYTSQLAQQGVIDLTNFIVSSEETFQIRFANADRMQGPFHLDDAVSVRPLPLPFEKPAGVREYRNRDYLSSHPEIWGEDPKVIVMSQQCRLNADIKALFRDPPRIILYSEFFVPSDIAARKEWPLRESMRVSMELWREKSLTDGLHADAIVVPTQFAKKLWPDKFQDKIHVIFDGVDTEHLSMQRIGRLSGYGAGFRESVPGKRLVAYIGRTIESIRGFDAWVKVYIRLREARPDLHFIVLGEDKIIQRGGGSEYYYGVASFKTYVLEGMGLKEEDLSDITWIPRLKFYDYLSLLSVLDIALYPMYGMFANWSLFQALQMGVPVVASDRAYLPEVFLTGENGYLADPDNVDSFVGCALKILDDPVTAASLRRNAQQTITDRYSVGVSSRRFASLLDALGMPVTIPPP